MATFVVYQYVNAGDYGTFGVFNTPDAIAATSTEPPSITPVNLALTGVMLSNVPPMQTSTWTWNPSVNFTPVPPTVSITPPTPNVYQTGFSVSYSQGNDVQQYVNPVDQFNANTINVGVAYSPSAPFQNLCLLLSNSFVSMSTFSTPIYLGMNGTPTMDAVESNTQLMWPVGGTFQGFAIQYLTQPGDSYSISFRKNGSTVWTISLPDSNSNTAVVIDTSTTASVSAGDLVNYQITQTGGNISDTLQIHSLVLGFRSQ